MEKYINSLIRGFKKIFNKKYFAIVSIFIGIVTVLGASYGYITAESGWKLAIQLNVRKLYYNIAIDGVSTNEITVPANSGTTYYDVEITSLNDINTKYSLTYYTTSNVTVEISSASTNKSSGIIGLYSTGTNSEKKKTVRIAVTNDTNDIATVTFNVAGGYTWNPDTEISMINNYSAISALHNESVIGLGLTLAEELDTLMNCTPTASVPCYYTNNSNNYLTYAGNTWRIIGTYLVNNKPVVKMILNDHLENKVTFVNVSSALTTFYNGLSDTSLIDGSPSSITKAEYDAIGGVNSYLYTKPNHEYWTATQYYVGTSRGASNLTSSSTAYVRPVVTLKPEVISGAVNFDTVTVSNMLQNGSFLDNYRETSNIGWDSTLNPNPPYRATGWSNGYNSYTANPSTGYHAHFEPNTFGYMVANFTVTSNELSRSEETVTQTITGGVYGGHKYYISAEFYSDTIGTENTLESVAAIVVNNETIISKLDFESYTSTASTINKWVRKSSIAMPTNTQYFNPETALNNIHIRSGNDVVGTTYAKNIMLIDLTEAFGAGNEPSSAWCDENIPFFEGTKTIKEKEGNIGTKLNPYSIEQGVKLNYANMTNATTNLKEGYYKAGQTYKLEDPVSTDNSKKFNFWAVSGTGASLNGTTLTMGTAATTITANWYDMYIYTGANQSFTAPVAGYYRVEVYNTNGSYAKGDIELAANEKLFIYVSNDTTTPTSIKCFLNNGVCGDKTNQNEDNSRIMYVDPTANPADGNQFTRPYTTTSMENSYVSGYAGMNAPATTGSGTTKANDPLHPTGKYFINGEVKFKRADTVGKVLISYIGQTVQKVNTALNNVRYIQDCTNANSYNNYNHWSEIQAISNGTNVAKSKTVTGTKSQSSDHPYTKIVDGKITDRAYGQPSSSSSSGSQCVVVDLGDTYDLDEIAVWHYYYEGRLYYSNVTSVSSDGTNYTDIINEAGLEISTGKRASAYGNVINGYVQDGLSRWFDGQCNYLRVVGRSTSTSTWKDLSPLKQNGTVSGTKNWSHDDYNSMYFNGTNTAIDCGDFTSDDITLESAFMLPSDYDSSSRHTILHSNTNRNYHLVVGNNRTLSSGFYSETLGDYATLNTSTSLDTLKKYSASFTYDGNVEKMFLQASQIGSNNITETITNSGGTPVMHMGARWITAGNFENYSSYIFHGSIFSVRVYNRALTEAEVYHNYLYDKELGYVD